MFLSLLNYWGSTDKNHKYEIISLYLKNLDAVIPKFILLQLCSCWRETVDQDTTSGKLNSYRGKHILEKNLTAFLE